ncbi:hypothetical protein HQ529_03750 [Candidatus Woesearchaeota archaeon]|nr:hypothetical protein [Candidatus Woesearchaeota archaeon]
MAKVRPLGLLVNQWEVKNQTKPFSLKSLYVMMHEWVLEKEYSPSVEDPDFPEISYYESDSQKNGREIWAKWRCFHIPQENPFYKFVMNVDIHGLFIRPVDVMHNGKKFKMDSGELYVSCEAILEVDWEGKWRKNWLLKHFLEVFWKRVFWKNMEKHRKEVYEISMELQTLIKEYLEIRRAIKAPKTYWPATGIKTEK